VTYEGAGWKTVGHPESMEDLVGERVLATYRKQPNGRTLDLFINEVDPFGGAIPREPDHRTAKSCIQSRLGWFRRGKRQALHTGPGPAIPLATANHARSSNSARRLLVGPSVTRWYHCVTRCVRRAFLLGDGPHDRNAWIEQRSQHHAQIFAVAVGGFSVLDNHLHLLVRLDPHLGAGRSDEVGGIVAGKLPAPGRLHGPTLSRGPNSRELAGILARLGSSAESWWARLEKLSRGRLLAGSSRPAENGCATSRHGWGCTTWPIWAVVRRDRYAQCRVSAWLNVAANRRSTQPAVHVCQRSAWVPV
jgi:hypothetical protein